jgi:hypothetical protein
MSTSEPELTFREVIRGHGTLRIGGTSVRVPAIALERAKHDSDAPWKLSAVVAIGDAERAPEIVRDARSERTEHLVLHGFTEAGDEFVIPDLALLNLQGRELSVDVHDIRFGPERLEWRPAEQSVNVYLTPTLIAQPLPMRKTFGEGRESRSILTGREPFRLSTSVGTFHLFGSDVIEHATVSGQSVELDVPIALLAAGLDPQHCSEEPHALIDHVEREVSPGLSILSLLSRGHVGWTKIEVLSQRSASFPTHTISAHWRTIHSSTYPRYLSPLVIPERLATDALDRITQRLRSFPNSDQLALAVPFLNNVFHAGFVEDRMISAFTALEVVISALPKPVDDEAADIRQVMTVLREALQDYVLRAPVSASTLERVQRKLDGLPHIPTAERTAALVEAYGVRWQDLWPASATLVTSLRNSFQFRHDLVHKGRLTNGRRAIPEAMRIHILTERLILAALGVQQDMLYEHAYRHVQFVRQELFPDQS